jgi:hypothetical protein
MENIVQGQWFRGPSADLGTPIDQSVRFYGTQRLTRTFTNNSGNTWTWSAWLKKTSNATGDQLIFGTLSPLQFTMARSNNFGWTQATVGLFESALRRDPSAWYHRVDVSDGTDIKMYINGDLIQTWTQASTGVNTNVEHFLGGDFANRSSEMWNGYIAQVYFIDGTAIGDTDGVIDEFGKYNTDGVWVPQDYTGTYGNNGFHLDFADNSDPGNDVSGNNNDWTAAGFQTTSTHENYDLDYNDTPTSNYSTLNALRSTVTTGRGTQDANLTLDGVDETWAATPGTCAQNSGKRFFEMEVSSSGSGANNNFIGFASSDCRFNIATLQDSATERAKGMMLLCDDGQTQLDTAARQTYTSNIAASNVIGCLIDFDDEEVEFFRNGTSLGAIDISSSPLVDGRMVLPVNITIGSPHNTHDQYLNYGQREFQHAPAGVTAADNGFETNNLPEPTIKNGRDYFDVITWSGDNVSPRTITGLEFEPDFIWTKRRNSTASHLLYDSVRGFGETRHLHSDVSDAEGSANELNTNVAGFVSDNASNGFVLTQGTSNHDATNGSGNTYAAWCWKAGGTAVTNTDGTNSNTVNVSANQDAGFSIVTYTGEASNSPNTIGHGLNAVPEFIIVKRRNATENWAVYHASLGNDRSLELHDSTAQSASTSAFWDSKTPTSSVFSVGNGGATNQAGGTYVAYVWAPKEGFSKFGSYTGLGSGTSPDADGPYTYLGFKPAFLLIKRFDNSFGGEWSIHDTTRSPQNPNRLVIAADIPNNEITQGGIDFLSNGFKIRDGGGWTNQSGGTYVYAAFAENPFGGQNQPPATAR